MTREGAKLFLLNEIRNIREEGPEDVAAWEYRGELCSYLERIEKGDDPDSVLREAGLI